MISESDLISPFDNVTNFTNISYQHLEYYNKYFEDVIYRIQRISFIVSGIIGLISYILTYLAIGHLRASLSDSAYIYHQSSTIFELIHMIVMIQYGALKLFQNKLPDNNYLLAIWSYHTHTGWYIGDTMKLALAVLTAFITFELILIVRFPSFYPNIRHKSLAYFAVVLSLIIGSAHLWPIFSWCVIYDQPSRTYIQLSTNFSDNIFLNFTANFIYVSKIGLSLAIFLFCIATAIGLRIEAKKISTWISSAKADWAAKRRLCAFTFILGICVLSDHIVWVIYKTLANNTPVVGDWENVETKFIADGDSSHFEYTRLLCCMSLAQAIMGQLVHSYRLVFYLLFNKSMRNGVRAIFERAKTKNRVRDIRAGPGARQRDLY